MLVGAGHSHVEILRRWAMNPLPDVQVCVISPNAQTMYSGMFPGFVAGQYKKEDISIDVVSLCNRAGAYFYSDHAVKLDVTTKQIHLQHLPPLHYHVLSFDIGSRPSLPNWLTGQEDFLLTTRPFDFFFQQLSLWDKKITSERTARIVCVGGGAAGFEILCALKSRWPKCEFLLIDRGNKLDRHQKMALQEKNIQLLSETDIIGGDPALKTLQTAKGETISFSALVWATGPKAPELFLNSSLPTEQGYIRVKASLEVEGHPKLFAAGDCAHFSEKKIEKAGVYAVREAPVLWENLRLALTNSNRLRIYHPQKRYLRLLNTSDGSAILQYGFLKTRGKWVMRWKDYIDRKFINQY